MDRPAPAESVTSEKILTAAAAVFRANPGAPMEAVAVEAGLSRATVHRYFPARVDMVTALRQRAVDTVVGAFVGATDAEEPPVVRMYTVTRQLLEAKVDWSWVLRDLEADVGGGPNPILAHAIDWMSYLRESGYLAAGADLGWAAAVYLTLVRAAVSPLAEGDSVTLRSARAVDTFLHGVGQTDVRYLPDRGRT